MLAGYLLGPNVPGFTADVYLSEQLATIGITLLMFVVGIHFQWKDLMAVKQIAVPGGILLSLICIVVGTLYSMYLGETQLAGFIIGVAICVSSTVVIVRVLTDQNLLQTKQGHIVVGWTIVEDLISVFGLLLLPSLAGTADATYLNIFYQISWVIVKIITLGLFVYFFGVKIIEYLLTVVSRTRSHELFTLAILACLFLIAIGSSYLFGVSLALGAFIAGMIVGKTNMSHQAAANALPMHDTFSVIFFLSVGMLFNPSAVTRDLPLFFGILSIILFLRPIVTYIIVRLYKYPTTIAATVALAIAQIGEYSFILVEEGSRLGILPDNAFDILVASAFITIGLNPILFQIFQPYLNKTLPASKKSDLVSKNILESFHQAASNPAPYVGRAIVIGFGPIGQIASHELLDNRYRVFVIDQNIDTIASLLPEQDSGFETLFGDAKQPHILEKSGIEEAEILIITTPDFITTELIIKTTKDLNPDIKIIARSRFNADVISTHLPGVTVICDEEASAEKFTSAIQALLKRSS